MNLFISIAILLGLVLMVLKVKLQGMEDMENGVEPMYIEDVVAQFINLPSDVEEESDEELEVDLDTEDN